ncbi:DUF2505 domain-containing protein [Kocuria turfanensis]|uniref:DUF2505 domain-containing protein n=1 Tax=Kocuria turfanensis TaxID=388357 RepID=A0A512IAB2_9MICC|nr:DUF2505 domain-containing protein [Kocuria turfanensis]GEO94629.1 hypothetical protein KTU01_07520 [Kocuria turfanensis]
MAVTASTTVPATVEQVVATFADEAFVRHVAGKAGATLESFERLGETTGAFTVTTVRAMPADRLPDVAQRFVGPALHVTQTDAYEAPAADGSRVVRSDIKVASLPVSGSAHQTLRPQGEQTEVHVDCTVEANIPFVGKQVAAAAEPYVSKALSLQSREAEAWLASR